MRRTLLTTLLLLTAAGSALAQAQPQPPSSEGLAALVKHSRIPIPRDVVIGWFPDYQTCVNASYYYQANPEFFTTYTCELRAKPLGRRQR